MPVWATWPRGSRCGRTGSWPSRRWRSRRRMKPFTPAMQILIMTPTSTWDLNRQWVPLLGLVSQHELEFLGDNNRTMSHVPSCPHLKWIEIKIQVDFLFAEYIFQIKSNLWILRLIGSLNPDQLQSNLGFHFSKSAQSILWSLEISFHPVIGWRLNWIQNTKCLNLIPIKTLSVRTVFYEPLKLQSKPLHVKVWAQPNWFSPQRKIIL